MIEERVGNWPPAGAAIVSQPDSPLADEALRSGRRRRGLRRGETGPLGLQEPQVQEILYGERWCGLEVTRAAPRLPSGTAPGAHTIGHPAGRGRPRLVRAYQLVSRAREAGRVAAQAGRAVRR